MSIKCVIIDDEPLARNVIKNYAEQIQTLDIINSFGSAVESLSYLEENRDIDLLFLDINMPLMDGRDLLKSYKFNFPVIITTAHPEHAVEAFELDVIDYLVKPIPFPRFIKAIKKVQDRITNNLSANEKEYIFIKINNKKMKKIYYHDILLIESLKDYIQIITDKEKYVIHKTLSDFTERLPPSKFIRIHRSHTIAIDKVNSIEGNCVEIRGKRYNIGRNYIEKTKETILN